MVADIVSATGCQVVLSSSWRHYPTMRDIVVFELGRVGVHILCDTEDRLDRNVEIQEVLDKYGVSGNDYAVIDDLSLTIPNLFKTSFYEGLTPHITAKVIAHFLKEICSV